MAKILIINGDNVRALEETEFAEESKLQDYLKDYPALIPLEDVGEGASELICIGKEVAVPSGAIDLLFIDKDGLLTVIETKLVKNPEIRREVIGQIIEYASYISRWSADKVYAIANAYLKSDLDEFMLNKYPEGFSADDFRSNIEQNLESGRIRLIIATNKFVEPLQATVTFLNSYSKFDILLLEVSSFGGKEKEKVLTSSLHGGKTSPPPPKQWDLPSFMADAGKKCKQVEVETMYKIYNFVTETIGRTEKSDKLYWGSGARSGTFAYYKQWHGKFVTLFTVCSDGYIDFSFPPMRNHGIPAEVLDSMRTYLNSISGIHFGDEYSDKDNTKYPRIRIKDLIDVENLDKFQRAVSNLLKTLNTVEEQHPDQ